MKQDLSERELEVLELAIAGHTDVAIAQKLGIQAGTVNSYWVRIRGKLGNFSRTELAARFVQQNADSALSAHNDQHTADAATLADQHRELLEKANAEIEWLKAQLAKERADRK